MSTSTSSLIKKLFHENSKSLYIEEPSNHLNYIATFKEGISKKLSPMLIERFKLAGHVDNADGIFDWLSLEEMNNTESYKERYEDKVDFFEGSFIQDYKPENVSIFAVNCLNNEIFLIWGDSVEPKIGFYYDANEFLYDNLNHYLKEQLS